MDIPKDKLFSRRTFAQRAVLLSASATIAPAGLLAVARATATATGQLPDNFPKLTAEGHAEAETRYQMVSSRYGIHWTEEEQNAAKLACFMAQPGLERLRSFPLKNGDVPALFLRPLVEREKLVGTKLPVATPAVAAKKS
ncbi:MAG TPA: hypothetical protein VII25_12845 [Candidatus Acidoferrum sp.]|jgi:hypothetical protein